MENFKYLPRVADEQIKDVLARAGALVIEGPKGSGKTESALQQARSEARLDVGPAVATIMATDPTRILVGEVPRLLDEWQVYPEVWNLVRHEVDDRHAQGQFILTGSTAPAEAQQWYSGAGRFARLSLQTMSLYESGESTGKASLQLVHSTEPYFVEDSGFTVEDLAARMCRGGWPGNVGLKNEQAMRNNVDYLRTIAEVDITAPDDIRRDPVRVSRVLSSLARGVGTEMAVSAIAADTALSRNTVDDYLAALARIFISQDQRVWTPKLRSRAPLRQAPKRHLADPALAIAALGKTPADLMEDFEFFGQLFESQVVHDLRALTGQPVYHARMATGEEVDAIMEIGGKTVFVEVKLGYRPEIIESAARSLKKFSELLGKDEAAQLIITGGGMSYRRPDGVNVMSIAHLAP